MFSTSEEQQRRYWDGTPKYRTVDHPVVQIFGRQRLAYLERWLDLGSIDSALDVGCGDGFSTVFMAERIRRVWAIDRSASMLARHPARGVLARADFLQLPFADGAVDLVYCWEVLHHLPDPSRAVAEMARVSRRYVLIAEPNRANPAQCAFALARRDHRWVFRYSQATCGRSSNGPACASRTSRRAASSCPTGCPRGWRGRCATCRIPAGSASRTGSWGKRSIPNP